MGKDGGQASHRRLGADGERGGVVGETGAGAQEGRELVRAISDRVSVRGWREGLAVGQRWSRVPKSPNFRQEG